MDADGTNVRMIRSVGQDGWSITGHGEFAPDGKNIIVVGTKDTYTQLFSIDLSGKILRQITSDHTQHLDPAYSLNGLQIAYTSCPTKKL